MSNSEKIPISAFISREFGIDIGVGSSEKAQLSDVDLAWWKKQGYENPPEKIYFATGSERKRAAIALQLYLLNHAESDVAGAVAGVDDQLSAQEQPLPFNNLQDTEQIFQAFKAAFHNGNESTSDTEYLGTLHGVEVWGMSQNGREKPGDGVVVSAVNKAQQLADQISDRQDEIQGRSPALIIGADSESMNLGMNFFKNMGKAIGTFETPEAIRDAVTKYVMKDLQDILETCNLTAVAVSLNVAESPILAVRWAALVQRLDTLINDSKISELIEYGITNSIFDPNAAGWALFQVLWWHRKQEYRVVAPGAEALRGEVVESSENFEKIKLLCEVMGAPLYLIIAAIAAGGKPGEQDGQRLTDAVIAAAIMQDRGKDELE